MKFRCPKEVLVRGVTAVQGAVGNGIANPVLQDICLTAYPEGKIEFVATNLSLGIRCIRQCDVERPGSIRVPSDVFIRLVKDLPIGEATIECVENKMSINSGRFKGKLSGASVDAFPEIRSVIDGTKSFMPVTTLLDLIRKTLFAATDEKSRFELDGIKMVARDGQLDAVTTDGRRLAWFQMPIEFSKMDLMIPSATAKILRSILPEEGDVEIVDGIKHVTLHTSDLEITSTLLTDKFPPYEKIAPGEGEIRCEIVCNRDDFMGAIRRTSTLGDTDSWRVILKPGEGVMEINTESGAIGGRGQEQVEIELNGDPCEAHFNSRYLLDFLRLCDTEKAKIRFCGGAVGARAHRAVFRQMDDQGLLYILMCLQTQEELEAKQDRMEGKAA